MVVADSAGYNKDFSSVGDENLLVSVNENRMKNFLATSPDTVEDAAVAGILPGDINGDGIVDLKDAQTVLKAALKLISLSDANQETADMNEDGQLTLADAQFVLKAALKLNVNDTGKNESGGQNISEESYVYLENLDWYMSNDRFCLKAEEVSVKDNFGKEHEHNIYAVDESDNSAWNMYRIDNKYKKLTGTIYLAYDHRNYSGIGKVRIYSGDQMIYESAGITKGSDPIGFSVDISNVKDLKVELLNTHGPSGVIGITEPAIYLSDVRLY